MNDNLKFSIITVNLNNAEGLRKTIDSVINQSYANCDHIIIDGGSADNSLKVIKEFEPIFKLRQRNINWVSEPDNGIYNAMNKGINIAKGDYLIFMNSGDTFYSKNTLETVSLLIDGSEFVYGNAHVIDHNNSWFEIFPQKLTLGFMACKFLCHQAIFYHRNIFEKIGLYNESIKVHADWYLNTRVLFFENNTSQHINTTICNFDRNGISSNSSDIKKQLNQVKSKLLPLKIWEELALSYSNERKLSLLKQSRLIKLLSILSRNISKTLTK
ncbi:glycosyltransferase family 2 protein [Carboxylicivirga marina]|uniref:glycosyltransferase family 2 protein n=1 Tax=Carboxylicivirga marina TaxID=2800988 RepID=UPI0025978958|nr:glycosyltransferase family 2 protein [uncultured Carboxylicivirga sp.]